MIKIAKSLIVGLLGGALLPIILYLLLIMTALYKHIKLAGLTPESPESFVVIGAVIFFSWLFLIVPVIIACLGVISLKINSESGLKIYDYLILPMISGIIASLLGLILFTIYHSINQDWMIVFHRLTGLSFYFEGFSILFIALSFFALLGIPFYNNIPGFKQFHWLINKKSQGVFLFIVSILLIASLMVIYMVILPVHVHSGSINIIDAYCDNNGYFNFTVVNNQPSEMNLNYKWHLDDPKAGAPRPIWNNGWTSDYYLGNGNITVLGKSSQNITIPIKDDPNYPMMFLVMDIELFNRTESIYHYREQKSTYGWNYSTLPPKPL